MTSPESRGPPSSVVETVTSQTSTVVETSETGPTGEGDPKVEEETTRPRWLRRRDSGVLYFWVT